jgi:RNA polymerase sigma factor (sigma-70 family)
MASFRYESLRHSLLTKQEELRLGRQLRRALQVQQKVDELLERKELQRLERLQAESLDEDVFTMEEELEDFLWRTQRTSESRQTQSGHYIRDYDMFDDDGRIRGFDEDDDEDDLLGLSVYGINEANALQEFDSRSVVTRGSNSFGIADIALSDQEIREHLGIDGGHKELSKILVEGALAKEQMIKCNIRLVMNIARKWMTRSNIGGDSNKAYVLMGSWTKPSLDEVVQEGILGLAKAAERFDPERNLKFSTYATYYITNEVRLAFQRATTGCLRVPSNYILIRNKYEKLVKEHYQQTGKGLDLAVAAEKLQYPMERLNFILRSTRPLLQLDGPVPMALASSAGKAGSNLGSYGVPPSFADTLECMEPSPEAVLERSLLRQCLENALANELSPHERDVLRLRHGLDDGVSRSVKEVVESCGGMMSPAEIRRAEFRAYSKLRTPTSLHNRRLLGFAAEFASFDPSESLEAY